MVFGWLAEKEAGRIGACELWRAVLVIVDMVQVMAKGGRALGVGWVDLIAGVGVEGQREC